MTLPTSSNSRADEGVLTIPINERDHTQGTFDAPLTLVEYGDFECPASREVYPVIRTVQQALRGRLCFAFRHFPLTNVHAHSEHAAEAAEASAEQGHFWEMHDILFEHQGALEDGDLTRYALELGLDALRLTREVMAMTYASRVREDFMGGVRSGVNGTPAFFMNGMRYDGPRDPDAMIAALTELGRPLYSRFP